MPTVNGPSCVGCVFHDQGTIYIPPRGNGANGVMLIGDSGWLNEAATTRIIDGQVVGTPFSGPSGWFMERNLKRIGVSIDDFDIANAIWCRAPRLGLMDNPEKYPEAAAASRYCRPYLDDFIAERKPKVLVPLGNVALRRVTGQSSVDKLHGYVIHTPYGIPAIPAYHPSFILQGNQKLAGAWSFIIAKALAIAQGRLEPFTKYELMLDPSLEKASAYLLESDPDNFLICDIETSESPEGSEDEAHEFSYQIVRISFSTKAGTAISLPWNAHTQNLVKQVLERAHNVVFWNAAFDAPRLAAAGAPVKGRIWDAMWAWHFLQSDLPKKLGFAAPLLVNVQPWKHLNDALPAEYSALDSAITMDCWNEIQTQLKKENRWDNFTEQCTDLAPILTNATKEGILIDVAAKSALLDGRLTDERDVLLKAIHEKLPNNVRPVKLYKKAGPKIIKPGEEYVPYKEIFQNVNGTTIKVDARSGGRLYLPFNPMSPKQRQKLFQALGLPIPYNKRSDSESIETKHLRKYAKRFPILKDIEDYSERQKIITAYDWPVDSLNHIHPEFGFNPSTWRKSCRNPNIQTIPKRSDLAKEFRKLFTAPFKHVYIECDSSAIEAVLVGYFANSPEYIALAKRGVHKWLAEKVAGRPVSKEEPLYDKVKRIVHLSNYMGTPMRIAEEYPDDFATVAEARKLQDFYFSRPEIKPVRDWQQQTLAIANHDHYLETPFGQRHYFYDVLNRRNGEVILGNDAKRAIAFMPQATASAIQTRYIHSLPLQLQLSIRAIIHDSIVLLVPEEESQAAAQTLYDVMTQPLPELGSLSIGAECKIGRNLGEMKLFTPQEIKTT